MSEGTIIALIVAVPAFLAAMAAMLQARTASNAIKETHILVNNRLSQLLAAVEKAALAQGRIEGAHTEQKAAAKTESAISARVADAVGQIMAVPPGTGDKEES